MRETLVKLADKFDQEGKHGLADAVDSLLTTASRPKAPLKSLDDDVKKDLLKFIHKVQENLSDSMESLEEFFRRLRYFDIGETVKDLKLDKALKELSKTQECMDTAGKAMFALSYGKHPSKSDLDQLAEDFSSGDKEKSNPLDFFESQNKYRDQDELVQRDEEGLRELEQSMYPEEDVSEEDLESFWGEDPELEEDYESFEDEPDESLGE